MSAHAYNVRPRSISAGKPVFGQDHLPAPSLLPPPRLVRGDAILLCSYPVNEPFHDSGNIIRNGMDSLMWESHHASMFVKQDGNIRVGNAEGLRVLGEYESLNERINAVLEENKTIMTENKTVIAKNKTVIAENKTVIEDNKAFKQKNKTLSSELELVKSRLDEVEDELQEVRIIDEEALKPRNRFFAHYIRDKKPRKLYTQEEKNIVLDGDAAVHQGAPLADALLFKRGIRKAVHGSLYQELYGMAWDQVLKIHMDNYVHQDIILEALRVHASTIATTYQDFKVDRSYSRIFREIVKAYQEGGDVVGTCAAFKEAHEAAEEQMEVKRMPQSWRARFRNAVSSRLSPILGYSVLTERQLKQ